MLHMITYMYTYAHKVNQKETKEATAMMPYKSSFWHPQLKNELTSMLKLEVSL